MQQHITQLVLLLLLLFGPWWDIEAQRNLRALARSISVPLHPYLNGCESSGGVVLSIRGRLGNTFRKNISIMFNIPGDCTSTPMLPLILCSPSHHRRRRRLGYESYIPGGSFLAPNRHQAQKMLPPSVYKESAHTFVAQIGSPELLCCSVHLSLPVSLSLLHFYVRLDSIV